MKNRNYFLVLSPDKITIHPSDTYSTTDEAIEATKKWKERYSMQGYYSSCNGRIPLEDILYHCTLMEFKNGKLKDQRPLI